MDPDQMISLVAEGALQGFTALLAGLWAYVTTHPWVWFFIAAMAALKILEVRLRRRRPRRR